MAETLPFAGAWESSSFALGSLIRIHIVVRLEAMGQMLRREAAFVEVVGQLWS